MLKICTFVTKKNFMFEGFITEENVEKLKSLGLQWVHSCRHPDDPERGVRFNYKTLWVKYNGIWYRYHQMNLGSLIYDFLYCKNNVDVKNKLESLVDNLQMEIFL